VALVVFADTNVLVKPFTRTLLWAGAPLSGYTITWSQYVEAEAARHLSARATPLSVLRERHDLPLSRTGPGAERFTATSAKDRQVLADASAAQAVFLITEDVDDFDRDDLAQVGVSAVQPDLFLAHRLTRAGYREAIEALSAGMTNPARTPAAVHAATNRRHPRVFATHAELYAGAPASADADVPGADFRGTTCVRCLDQITDDDGQRLGLCDTCRKILSEQ
jgi:hypothetical protein